MRKTMSVFCLATATSFGRILLVLAALAATQLMTAWTVLENRIGDLALEQILDHPVYRFSPAVALALVTAALLLGHGGSRSRVNYTMARLSLPPRPLFTIHAVYCVGVYLLFWMVQVSLAVATAGLYRSQVSPETVSAQLMLLTCYRSAYLHPLLPLADWPFWVTTPLICLGLGIHTAQGMVRSWAGKVALSPVIFALLTALYTAEPGDYTWATLLVFVVWAGVCLSGYRAAAHAHPQEVTS